MMLDYQEIDACTPELHFPQSDMADVRRRVAWALPCSSGPDRSRRSSVRNENCYCLEESELVDGFAILGSSVCSRVY